MIDFVYFLIFFIPALIFFVFVAAVWRNKRNEVKVLQYHADKIDAERRALRQAAHAPTSYLTCQRCQGPALRDHIRYLNGQWLCPRCQTGPAPYPPPPYR